MENSHLNNEINCSFYQPSDQDQLGTPVKKHLYNLDLANTGLTNTSLQISHFSHSPSPFKSRIFSPSFIANEKTSEFTFDKSISALSEKLKKIEKHMRSNSPAFNEEFNTQDKPLQGSEAIFVPETDFSRGNKEIPTLLWCAYCKGETSTSVKYNASSKTFFSSLGIFLAGGIFGCFMIPYMTDSCKSPVMMCAKCGRMVGN